MRDIKFRCWDIVRKKMRGEYDLWDIPYNEIFIHTPDQRALNIMQYTGLKDINGKEIYEGDIVRYYSTHIDSWGGKRYEINYTQDGEWALGEDWLLSKKWRYCEVIGNIYENPELLK